MAVNLKISGFSDNLFKFAEMYIKILMESAEKEFDQDTVRHSVEKIRTEYANNNNEVDDKASHNRLLMLIPHSFHDKLMEKELKELLDDWDLLGGFDPSEFLKNTVLANIMSVEVMIFGNTSEEDSKKFCNEIILKSF